MESNPAKIETRPAERLAEVRILDGGHCFQSEYMSGWPTLRVRRFHAMFLYFRHPTHGEAVVDTGYSPRFFDATRKLPEYLYRWATPVPRCQMADESRFFARYRIDAGKVKTVFLSHFHADHIGGLCHYPESRIVCDAGAIAALQRLSAWERTKAGFLPGLLPGDCARRTRAIDRSAFSAGGSLCAEGDSLLAHFQTFDYWGDGSLVLIDLPGHAEGQVGFLLNTDSERIFYVADAYWDIRVLRTGRQIPLLARRLQHDWPAYLQTQGKLRALDQAIQAANLKVRLLATHCLVTHSLSAQGPTMHPRGESDAS